jgi:hypothetical protein
MTTITRFRGITAAALALLAFAAPRSRAEDDPKAQLEHTLERYELFFLQSFTVNVKSPEINALITQIAAAAKKMSIPLRINVDHFIFDYRNGKTTITVSLANVPPQAKSKMEAEANKLIRTTSLGKFLTTITYESIKKGIDFLSENKELVTVKKNTADYVDFFIKGRDQTFGSNLKLKGLMFRMDRKMYVISAFRFTFDGNRSLLVRLAYKNSKLPESGLYVPALSKTFISQSGILNPGKGMKILQRATIYYWNYHYRKAEEKKSTGNAGAGGATGLEPGGGAGGGAEDPW